MYINIWYLATCNIVVTFQKIWLIISPLSYILHVGQLYLENKELLRLLDSQNQALGQRNNQIDNLQREKKNLQRYLEGTYIRYTAFNNKMSSSLLLSVLLKPKFSCKTKGSSILFFWQLLSLQWSVFYSSFKEAILLPHDSN